MIKIKNSILSMGFIATSILAVNNTAQAANFTTNTSGSSSSTGNIFLQSITQNGKTFSDFSLVESANIIYNTPYKGGNTGAASTDRGDTATSPFSPNENPTATEIAAFLGNKNLNNIIDTEDNGSFDINVFFDSLITADNSGLDNLFFWERGKNSALQIQALDASGTAIGKALKLTKNTQASAGFSINTTEINEIQPVGSWGVNLKDLGVTELKGLKLIAESSYEGPDFKVVARKPEIKKTPEPSAVMGLGVVATLAFLSRTRLKQRTAH
jgi:hypothetical protein